MRKNKVQLRNSVAFFNEVHDKFKQHFSDGFHTFLWEIIINERFYGQTVALTAVIAKTSGYELGVAEKGDSGYIVTSVSFVTRDYDEAEDITEKLNEALFGHTMRDAASIVLSTMGRQRSA